MINLFINYYVDKNASRNKELLTCIQRNINNKLIDNIFVLCSGEDDNKLFESDKVSILVLKSRPTYNVFFYVINKYTSKEDWNIISNTDIYFDSTIGLLNKYNQPKTLVALTRWDITENNTVKFLNRADSQDTWAIKGHVDILCGNFNMGTPGCDNVIAQCFFKSGWKVINPSKSIKTYHLHSSNIRNYTSSQRLPPPYKLIPPTL